ncbi:MAG: hypothetical protein KDC26_03850 [Armatimonadetes bacterium]|nr:hypothetical protein [Armatimonadota bacterium]
MKFRRLYWVTEQIDADGKSTLGGVFTSIYDLTHKGLKWNDSVNGKGFRLSLVKLDCESGPLGTWNGPDFSGLEEDLEPFIASTEFDRPSVEQLGRDVRNFASS